MQLFIIREAQAVVLHRFMNYNQHETIEECDRLQRDWEQCMVTSCSSESSMNEREAKLCYIQMAVKNNDLTVCSKYGDQLGDYWQSDCLTEMAIVNEDYSICGMINSLSFKSASISVSPADKPKDFSRNACSYHVATNTGNIPACNDIKELDTGFLKDCHIKSLDKGWMFVSKDPNLCSTFPSENQSTCYLKAVEGIARPEMVEFIVTNFNNVCDKFLNSLDKGDCYQVALEALRQPEMAEYVTKKFDSICEKFPSPKDKVDCYNSSLDIIGNFDNLKFITGDISICLRFPENYHSRCYDKALDNSSKLSMGNQICVKFPPSQISQRDIVESISSALSFNSILQQESATREKCFIELGVNLKSISSNDHDFMIRNTVSLAIIILLFLANILTLVFGVKKLSLSLLRLLGGLASVHFIILYISLMQNWMIDVLFFYPSLFYLGIIALFSTVAFYLIRRKRLADGILYQ